MAPPARACTSTKFPPPSSIAVMTVTLVGGAAAGGKQRVAESERSLNHYARGVQTDCPRVAAETAAAAV